MPTTTYITPSVDFDVWALAGGDAPDDGTTPIESARAIIGGLLSPGRLRDPDAYMLAGTTGFGFTIGSGTPRSDLCVVAGTTVGQESYLVRAGDALTTSTAPTPHPTQAVQDEIWLVVHDDDYDSSGEREAIYGYREGDPSGGAPGPDTDWRAAELLWTILKPPGSLAFSEFILTDERARATLSPLTVGPDSLQDAAVTSRAIAPQAVVASHIAPGALPVRHISAGASAGTITSANTLIASDTVNIPGAWSSWRVNMWGSLEVRCMSSDPVAANTAYDGFFQAAGGESAITQSFRMVFDQVMGSDATQWQAYRTVTFSASMTGVGLTGNRGFSFWIARSSGPTAANLQFRRGRIAGTLYWSQ